MKLFCVITYHQAHETRHLSKPTELYRKKKIMNLNMCIFKIPLGRLGDSRMGVTVTKIWDYVTNASNNFFQEIRGKYTK